MIKFLSDKAVCMCPHGGKLQFISTHMKADGMDGSALTIQDYQNAMIVGCTMPPPPAGVSPCLKVAAAIDPMGQAMKINGINAVTEMVQSFTDKGWPIIVVYPGMSAMSINIDPSAPSFKKAEFAQASAQKQSGLGIGQVGGAGPGTQPWKDVISAFWRSDYLRREQTAILAGTTVGYGDGTSATLLIYEFDLEGNHEYVDRTSGTVKQDQVEVEWVFDYRKDVAGLPSVLEGAEFYSAPSYFFELKVAGKSATSGLIEFRDYTEVELTDEDNKPRAYAEYTAQFADGSQLQGVSDSAAIICLEDIPPGNVHWQFVPQAVTVHIRLNINPEELEHQEDRFKLFSTDGNYESLMTPKNDAVVGDVYIDLIFEQLDRGLRYSLEVQSQNSTYLVFEAKSTDELARLSPRSSDVFEDTVQEEPDEVAASEGEGSDNEVEYVGDE